VDERRHNMDGALFVDDERGSQDDDRGRNSREAGSRARSGARSGYDDGKADAARRITQGILDRMDLEASVHVREDDEQVVLDIDGPDAGRAIGKKGMTLEALQFLVNKIVNREPDERRHIVLDSGDYRERHDNGLVSMAKREAKRAISSGRPVTLEPMSARDRRVIHVSLAKFPGISTRSEGEGMDRRLQIIPAREGRGERDDRPARADRGERTPRNDRARDDRPRDDRARDDRAREDRPREDRPREERVTRDDRGERRDERPTYDDRPRDDRPRDDRPRDDRPRDDRPRDDRPRDERTTREERPRERTSDRPRDERSLERTSDRPRDERPVERTSDRPRDERAGLVERARDDRARSTRDDRARPASRDRDR
jgi:spoIIIJ-associated protein